MSFSTNLGRKICKNLLQFRAPSSILPPLPQAARVSTYLCGKLYETRQIRGLRPKRAKIFELSQTLANSRKLSQTFAISLNLFISYPKTVLARKQTLARFLA